MLTTYTLREAKARLSELLNRAAAGEEVEIVRRSGRQERFRLVRIDESGAVRRPGSLKGRLSVPEDFDAEDPRTTAAFESGI